MPVSKKAVSELHDKCGLAAEECLAALGEHDGNVNATLGALIDTDRVKTSHLNPESVSDELFERAARRQKVAMYEKYMKPGGGLAGLISKMAGKEGGSSLLGGAFDKLAAEYDQLKAAKYGNKTAEEIIAEEEAQKAAQLKKLGVKPPSAGEQARRMALISRRSAWLKEHPQTLKLKPFPPLKLTLSEWEGVDVLEAWAGTQARQGAYTSRSSKKASKGEVSIQMPRRHGDEDDAHPQPPWPEQMAAYSYLKENQVEVTNVVLEALLKYYKKVRKQWLKGQPDLELPVIDTVEEMRQNVGLGIMHVHEIAKGGSVYIGLELGCTWDEEHGAGVLLHRERVIDVGQADTSFDDHAAMKDGGKRLEG